MSLQISPQLNHVNLIKATEFAFAALKSDGQVVAALGRKDWSCMFFNVGSCWNMCCDLSR